MRSLLVLVLVFALGNCDRRKRAAGGWGTSLASARIDAHEMRLNQIAKHLEELEDRVEHEDHSIPASMHSLELRLDEIAGDDCGDHEFSCGRHSGQCIAELGVCDHEKDCDNGHDEDEDDTCVNSVPAGRSWTGIAHWDSCLVRNNNKMSILITGNKRYDHFPTRMWVDAVIIEDYSVSGVHHDETWHSKGYYDYAHKTVHLNPPKESKMGIGMRCHDGGHGVASCEMVRESDHHVCGHATLVREEH